MRAGASLKDDEENDDKGDREHDHRWQEYGSPCGEPSCCWGLVMMIMLIGAVLGRVCLALIHG